MKKTNQMVMVGQFIDFKLDELQTAVADWIILLRIIGNPQTFQIDQEDTIDFDAEDVVGRIEWITEEDDFWWRVTGEEGQFQIHVSKGSLFIRNIYEDEDFKKNEILILDYFDHRMLEHGLYGTVRSYDDYLYNNVPRIEDRANFETPDEIEKLPMMYNQYQRLIIDCNQLAGYEIFFRGLSFTSCWKMYFSNYYFDIIPKPIFEDVQQVESVESLSDELVKITLYKNPQNWDLEINKGYQRTFRDQMGIDGLVWNNGIGILREPCIEYSFSDSVVHTVQYQNGLGQPVPKKKATHFMTRTFDFGQNRYYEKKLVGNLNSQAYFPWVDDIGKNMMNYRVLKPSMAIDGGLTAFEYYIREFLEIEIEEEKAYNTYTSVLRFYLPEKELLHLPLQEIQEKMKDVTFKEIKKRTKAPSFDLTKGKNHLRIIFLDMKELETLQKVNKAEN